MTKIDIDIKLPSGKTYTQPIVSFINNEFVPSSLSTQPISEDNSIPVYNPSTGEKVVDIYEASDEDFKKTVEYAKEAYKTWKNVSQGEKRDLFLKLAELLEKDKELIAEIGLCKRQ